MLKFKSVRLAAVALGAALLAAPHFASAQANDTKPAEGKPAQREGMRGRRGMSGRGMSAEARLNRMAELLALTDDQKAKLKPVFEQNAKDMKALMEDQALTREQKREKFSALRKTSNEAVEAVLTPEQKEKLAKSREEMRKRFQNRRQGAQTPKSQI